MGETKRALALFAVALAVAQVAACSAGGGAAPAGVVHLALQPDAGTMPARYRVVANLGQGQVLAVTCPATAAPGAVLACSAEGVDVTTQGALEVLVKAPGFAWAQAASPAGATSLAVPLAALPAPQATADYATAFAPGSQLSAFTDLAWKSSSELGPALVVKFTILDLQTAPRVYFQDTPRHPLHYDFAHDVLGVPLSLHDFEATTYHGPDRQAMAGSLVYFPALETALPGLDASVEAPVVLEFFPNDDLTPEQALIAHRLLEERLPMLELDGGLHRLVYLPAGELQEGQAAAEDARFRAADVLWARRSDVYGNLAYQLLNPGLAYGTLRRLSPQELEATVVSFQDVLLLTSLPTQLPLVGGTITEELQTPLAHVNVMARTRGTPNIALPGASADPRVQPFLGKLVRFEVRDGAFTLAEATLEEAQQFWSSRHPEPFVPQADLGFTDLASMDDLGFDDWTRVGVKAANLAELHHLIPEQSPQGFAVPFRHYEDFVSTARVDAVACQGAAADCVDEGRPAEVCQAAQALCLPAGESETVRDHLARLLADAGFGSDSALREASLDGVRWIMRNAPLDPAFADQLTARVSAVFGDAKVKMRSSTNAEDLPGFSGAGLYDSVAAYANGSKAAADRIRQVWASVWNWRAFEERSWWGVDHLAVRMGVAVMRSFPDEAANGVLITQNIADPFIAGMYVNVQAGETSVTNPPNGEVAEVFVIVPSPQGVQVARQRFSSLSPGEPILSPQEVWDLFLAAYKVQEHFAPLYQQSPAAMALDLEFKFENPDRALFIKQVRPYTAMSW